MLAAVKLQRAAVPRARRWYPNVVLLVSLILVGFFRLSSAQLLPEQTLACSGPGYRTTYIAGWQKIGPSVNVIYRRRRPTSAEAEAALRKCVKVAADTMFITNDLLATAFFGTSEIDEEPVVLSDGSSNLVYDPKTKQVRTMNEYEGSMPSIVQAKGYFVQYEEHSVLVKPGGKFASLSVVFAKRPTEKTAYETLIAELLKTISRTDHHEHTDAYAYTGSKNNPADWHQIKGANGKYISGSPRARPLKARQP
jgi:hypothetical protein